MRFSKAGLKNRRARRLHQVQITSDNICHIKSRGVGSDWLRDSRPRLRRSLRPYSNAFWRLSLAILSISERSRKHLLSKNTGCMTMVPTDTNSFSSRKRNLPCHTAREQTLVHTQRQSSRTVNRQIFGLPARLTLAQLVDRLKAVTKHNSRRWSNRCPYKVTPAREI